MAAEEEERLLLPAERYVPLPEPDRALVPEDRVLVPEERVLVPEERVLTPEERVPAEDRLV